MFGVVVAVIIGIFLLTSCGGYSTLVSKQTEVDQAWAIVESKLQRRMDLIPNLVASVKGAMSQEKEVFSAIAEARTRYTGATTTAQKAEAAGQVEAGLARLLVIVENYPQLHSLDAVRDFMAQLEGTENRISIERDRYNIAVNSYNTARRQPITAMGRIFGDFPEAKYFKAAEGATVAPVVNFGSGR
jgi:LemA protein